MLRYAIAITRLGTIFARHMQINRNMHAMELIKFGNYCAWIRQLPMGKRFDVVRKVVFFTAHFNCFELCSRYSMQFSFDRHNKTICIQVIWQMRENLAENNNRSHLVSCLFCWDNGIRRACRSQWTNLSADKEKRPTKQYLFGQAHRDWLYDNDVNNRFARFVMVRAQPSSSALFRAIFLCAGGGDKLSHIHAKTIAANRFWL